MTRLHGRRWREGDDEVGSGVEVFKHCSICLMGVGGPSEVEGDILGIPVGCWNTRHNDTGGQNLKSQKVTTFLIS